jgi:hypothetical protein
MTTENETNARAKLLRLGACITANRPILREVSRSFPAGPGAELLRRLAFSLAESAIAAFDAAEAAEADEARRPGDDAAERAATEQLRRYLARWRH